MSRALHYAEEMLRNGYCFVPIQNPGRQQMLTQKCHQALARLAKMPLDIRMRYSFCFDRSEGANLTDQLDDEAEDGYILRSGEDEMKDDKHAWHGRSDLRRRMVALGVEIIPEVDVLLHYGNMMRERMQGAILTVVDELDRHPSLSNLGIGDLMRDDSTLNVVRFLRYVDTSNRQGDVGVVAGFHQDRGALTCHDGSNHGSVQICKGNPLIEKHWRDVVRPHGTHFIFGAKKLAIATGATQYSAEVPGGKVRLWRDGMIAAVTHRGKSATDVSVLETPRTASVLFSHHWHGEHLEDGTEI